MDKEACGGDCCSSCWSWSICCCCCWSCCCWSCCNCCCCWSCWLNMVAEGSMVGRVRSPLWDNPAPRPSQNTHPSIMPAELHRYTVLALHMCTGDGGDLSVLPVSCQEQDTHKHTLAFSSLSSLPSLQLWRPTELWWLLSGAHLSSPTFCLSVTLPFTSWCQLLPEHTSLFLESAVLSLNCVI